MSFWNEMEKIATPEVRTLALKTFDYFQESNSRAASNAGLEVRVTRIYDGVGLSNGRRCEWCLARCGNNMPYDKAYAKGAFERHPGCECILEYTTSKGTQTQTNWRRNQWQMIRAISGQ